MKNQLFHIPSTNDFIGCFKFFNTLATILLPNMKYLILKP